MGSVDISEFEFTEPGLPGFLHRISGYPSDGTRYDIIKDREVRGDTGPMPPHMLGGIPLDPDERDLVMDMAFNRPLDRIYDLTTSPIIQVGVVVGSVAIIGWSYSRLQGRSRYATMALGVGVLFLLAYRNSTAVGRRNLASHRAYQWKIQAEAQKANSIRGSGPADTSWRNHR